MKLTRNAKLIILSTLCFIQNSEAGDVMYHGVRYKIEIVNKLSQPIYLAYDVNAITSEGDRKIRDQPFSIAQGGHETIELKNTHADDVKAVAYTIFGKFKIGLPITDQANKHYYWFSKFAIFGGGGTYARDQYGKEDTHSFAGTARIHPTFYGNTQLYKSAKFEIIGNRDWSHSFDSRSFYSGYTGNVYEAKYVLYHLKITFDNEKILTNQKAIELNPLYYDLFDNKTVDSPNQTVEWSLLDPLSFEKYKKEYYQKIEFVKSWVNN